MFCFHIKKKAHKIRIKKKVQGDKVKYIYFLYKKTIEIIILKKNPYTTHIWEYGEANDAIFIITFPIRSVKAI